MQLPRFIFINGPIGSGKTTLINQLIHADAGMFAFSTGYPVLSAVDVLLHDFDESSDWTSQDWRNEVDPNVSTGKTREKLVFDMQAFVEQNCGPMFLGKKSLTFLNKVKNDYENILIACNRQTTYSVITEDLAFRDIGLVRLHRAGVDWNDRGEYIVDSRVNAFDLQNDGAPEDLLPKFMAFFS